MHRNAAVFNKKPTPKAPVERQRMTESAVPRYQHPKIFLIDMAPVVGKALESEGYNVSRGTFGTPYTVQKSSGYQPVVMNASLSDYAEQEIIVIDLVPAGPVQVPPIEKLAPTDELDWWSKTNRGQIDPRPRAMVAFQDKADRILTNGGVFVIFSDARSSRQFVFAKIEGRTGGLTIQQEFDVDNWNFLSELSYIAVKDDHGEEIATVTAELQLLSLIHISEPTRPY